MSPAKRTSQKDPYSFMWALEVDLVNAATPRARMFDHFQMPEGQRTTRELLKSRGKAIKKQEVLISAISELSANALPNSYKALRREIPRLAASSRGRA
jgi:hypothetical protein